MKHKVLSVATAIYFALTGIFSGISLAQAADKNLSYEDLAFFGEVFERVRAQYVTAPDDKKLIEDAINGMVTALDPHSSYMTPEEARAMRITTKGSFGGLGIEVTKQDNKILIVTAMEGGPAARAGILSKDQIIKVNGETVASQSLNDVVKKMRGKIGTKITLTILRPGEKKFRDILLTREEIKVQEVRAHLMKDVGYIRLFQFSEQTYDDLVKAIKKINSQIPANQLKGYILDLRLNPGGLLDQAVKVSSAFLDHGEIVSTRGRDPQTNMRFEAEGTDIIRGKPLIVLINGGTASAAEIVSGALQDHERAIILGTRSFGKGSVQTIIPLGDKGALRLTTALYYTPSGKSIQGKGIVPDIIVKQPLPEKFKNFKISLGESQLRGHIKGQEEDANGSGSAAYVPLNEKDDMQLQEAYKLLRGEIKNKKFAKINANLVRKS